MHDFAPADSGPIDSAPDWSRLQDAAVEVSARAYAPYSGYRVGAAALVDDGRIVVGTNVENASYGVTLCAECSLVGSLICSGGGRLIAFTCVNGQGDVIMPCGRCRQLLSEHASPDLLIATPEGIMAFTQVLPLAFGPQDLGERA